MATTVIKTVKPFGGDYTSLSAWEAGEQRDLVALNEIAVAECYSMSETTAVIVNGFTTDATRYIEIRTPLSERHNGKWDATKYNLKVVDADALVLADDHVRVVGLQIAVSSTQYGRNGITISFPHVGAEFQISKNIIDGQSSTLSSSGIAASSSGNEVVKIWDNIIYDFHHGWSGGISVSNCAAGSFLYNNTIYGCQYGLKSNAINLVVKNHLSVGNNRNAYNGTPGASSDYNASDDTTSTGGANDRTSQTFTFVDAVNRDLHLASTDAGARDFGVDLSVFFTDDIDGHIRTATWDIGAAEYVAAGGVSIPLSGITAGIGAVTGKADMAYGAVAVIAGLSAANALAGLTHTVTGMTTGYSAFSGSTLGDFFLSGATAAASGATGKAALNIGIAGVMASVSVPFANAFIVTGASGVINGLSLLSGAITPSGVSALIGSVNVLSSLSGGAGVLKVIKGALIGSSFFSADIMGLTVQIFAGHVDALSTFAGGVAMGYGPVASSVSASLLTAHINEIISCSGVVSGTLLMSGIPRLAGQLSHASLIGVPKVDVTRYGGGRYPTVQAASETTKVTQDNINPGVTR